MKEIQLTKGYAALVDDDDFEKLSKFKWHAQVIKNTVYAVHHGRVCMHRLIMNTPKGFETDHINHNGLDNRKENLRIVTKSQNSMNTHKTQISKYEYKGVYYLGDGYKTKPYGAQIKYGEKRHYIGAFENIIDAAKAYDKKASELFGEFACLNFPA